MNLFELCRAHATAPSPESVPSWTLGCFRRRSITFFSGESEASTRVLWLQSRGLTADLRLAEDRPRLASQQQLFDLSLDDLLRLAEVEGGLSPSRFVAEAASPAPVVAGVMDWLGWEAFQVHAKWPEPGLLRRVGDCLIEFAPSGAYVEDWRLQPSGEGALIGLTLLEERERQSGVVVHRGGGLVICGTHALFVRGRPAPLPQAARLSELLAGRERALIAAVFGFEASYARTSGTGEFTIEASTLPWREGQPLLSLEGFTRQSDGSLLQRVLEGGREIERRFGVDTLEPRFLAVAATPAAVPAQAWLRAEAGTLLRAAKRVP